MIASDGVGPPQKERPHHPVRPPSHGPSQPATALVSNTPAPILVQGRKEGVCSLFGSWPPNSHQGAPPEAYDRTYPGFIPS